MTQEFRNRLRKRYRHLRKWAARWPTTAYRVYDWDIPEFAWTVDRYADRVFAQWFAGSGGDDVDPEIVPIIAEVLNVAVHDVSVRTRRRQKGAAQYERLDAQGARFTVSEGPHEFWVNLDEYIDTGLFLDHRELRRDVARNVAERGSNTRVLNLFAYTGAFSVWAAAAGAHVTTIDLSNTYLDWGRDNFRLNGIDPAAHRFERSDILRFLPQERRRAGQYDIIVLDPPTFSRSKKMERDLDIQRDWTFMVDECAGLLRRGGELFFSTNFREFELDVHRLSTKWHWTETTARTVPEDFRPPIHRSWRFVRA